MDETNDSKRYVGRVQEELQRYIRELLSENGELRGLLTRLRTENLAVMDEAQRLRTELEGHRQKQFHLHHQVSEVERENRKHAEAFAQIEQQNANLANLYVASYQLASTIGRSNVLQAIQEIVANLIGSEEVAIYEVDETGTRLRRAWQFGIEDDSLASILIGQGTIGRAAAEGTMYVSPTGTADSEGLTACIPLSVDGRLVGVVAIFRLLGHKPAIAEIDRNLFDLLAVHAATSLYLSNLHEGSVH